MIIENSSDIILEHKACEFSNQERYEALLLRDGKAIVISNKHLALYKSIDSVNDPLGNGLLQICDLPTNTLEQCPLPWVNHFRAGFISLSDDKALLITPLAIQFFATKNDALHNQNEICKLSLDTLQ